MNWFQDFNNALSLTFYWGSIVLAILALLALLILVACGIVYLANKLGTHFNKDVAIDRELRLILDGGVRNEPR